MGGLDIIHLSTYNNVSNGGIYMDYIMPKKLQKIEVFPCPITPPTNK